ncbi:hypothetical protein OGM63_15660 [Plectonema radiosum NIES-515]|uniref:Uncharacterized protein n=1 Tax=Plectonema radiosum NIES-515 TaxID=2986073 RepID=A0ABT3B0P4_9CYAN|nr:hypothetical protein [Plectonema radiosum]MCV3214932.1 hypothetical protein [Plectonema radiosum NIES-515]
MESAPAHQHFNADMVVTLSAPVQRYFLDAIAQKIKLGFTLDISRKQCRDAKFRVSTRILVNA